MNSTKRYSIPVAAVVLVFLVCCTNSHAATFQPQTTDAATSWTSRPFKNNPLDFQFAIVSDRTGGCRMADIPDGTSNTLAIGEVTGAGPGSHSAHAWVLLGHTDTYDGINGPFTVPGGADCLDLFGYTIRPMGPSSFHPGGCHFTMADGSVQFISENISQPILAALTTRAGEEVFHYGF